MTIKEVTIYEASDGTQFTTEEEAIDHENYIKFRDWYMRDNELICGGTHIGMKTVYDWLIKHKKEAMDLI